MTGKTGDAIMHPDMNYQQAEEFLLSLTDYEKSPGVAYNSANYDLRRMELLLEALVNPHLGRTTVHIAGTKGKGSTAAMISSVLAAAGYRTGLFTSPHLHNWRERVALNGHPISEKDFARLAADIQPVVLSINQESRYGKLTTFEVITAMAFSYFSAKKAGSQVLETGMGGRLDATNVVDPDVCIITSISLDHTQVLGESLAQIASEKAGIIKAGSTVVSALQPPEAAVVIEQRCRYLNVPLIIAKKDIKWKRLRGDLSGQVFTVAGISGNYEFFIPLLGDHQLDNASLAVAALEVLKLRGIKIDFSDMAKGLSTVHWPARLQVLNSSPVVIIDGAHNVDSIKKVVESVKKYFTYERSFVIFGSSSDKDIAGMAMELAHFANRIVLTTSSHPRATTTGTLADIFKKAGVSAIVEENIVEALANTLAIAGSRDLILITGSLFLAADAERAFTGLGEIKTPPPFTDFRCFRVLNK